MGHSSDPNDQQTVPETSSFKDLDRFFQGEDYDPSLDTTASDNPAPFPATDDSLIARNPADGVTGGLDKARQRLVFALDIDLPEPALEMARALRGVVTWIKVGVRLYLRGGRPLLEELRGLGFQVFLDLKFHDIPAQVEGATFAAARIGVDMMTIHASGGRAMMEAAVRGARGGAESIDREPPIVLAVTVLTSLDDDDLADLGVTRATKLQVLELARLAHSCGCSGVVCSPRELPILRQELPPPFALLTPGIRPASTSSDDQKRVTTPADACRGGSNYLVVGRPIRKAPEPVEAARRVLDEMAEALSGR